eukprot:c21258_g1_i1.p1 GENE.c21258_g1_i1~~c21258_g1_i1.p1  ORF type:complete len:123 (+),score=20.81 c21258_g1_i1:35-370(+)
MDEVWTPRVDGRMLQSLPQGQLVRLVGKVVQFSPSNGVAVIEACDGVNVNVQRTEMQPFQTTFVEVIGRVENGNTIEETQSNTFGDSFDLGVYGEAVALMNGQYRHLFCGN